LPPREGRWGMLHRFRPRAKAGKIHKPGGGGRSRRECRAPRHQYARTSLYPGPRPILQGSTSIVRGTSRLFSTFLTFLDVRKFIHKLRDDALPKTLRKKKAALFSKSC
jgi:hypothetical protein